MSEKFARMERLQKCLAAAASDNPAVQYHPISAAMNQEGEVVIVTTYKALQANSHFEPEGFLTSLAESLPKMMCALTNT